MVMGARYGQEQAEERNNGGCEPSSRPGSQAAGEGVVVPQNASDGCIGPAYTGWPSAPSTSNSMPAAATDALRSIATPWRACSRTLTCCQAAGSVQGQGSSTMAWGCPPASAGWTLRNCCSSGSSWPRSITLGVHQWLKPATHQPSQPATRTRPRTADNRGETFGTMRKLRQARACRTSCWNDGCHQ